MIDQWFTIITGGHIPYSKSEEITTIEAAKASVVVSYPHFVELPFYDAPAHPMLVFDEDKSPWTSFCYLRHLNNDATFDGPAIVVFAFSEVRDAIEFRLRLV